MKRWLASMSVVNITLVGQCRIWEPEKKVLMLDATTGAHTIFDYDFYCKTLLSSDYSPYGLKEQNVYFFFNFNTKQCAVLLPSLSSKTNKQLITLNFWVTNDVPVLSANIIENQNEHIKHILEEFRTKYADILIDNVINENN